MRHRWIKRDDYNSHCDRCGTWAQKRPHPHARRWFTEWRPPDGTYVDNYNGHPTPPCTTTYETTQENPMAGAYCKFCDFRCFVLRIMPADAKWKPGYSVHLATCAQGAAHDRERTGYDHITAINPLAETSAQ